MHCTLSLTDKRGRGLPLLVDPVGFAFDGLCGSRIFLHWVVWRKYRHYFIGRVYNLGLTVNSQHVLASWEHKQTLLIVAHHVRWTSRTRSYFLMLNR